MGAMPTHLGQMRHEGWARGVVTRSRGSVRQAVLNVLLCLATILLIEVALRHVIGGMEHVLLYDLKAGGTESCGGLQPAASVMYTGWFMKVPAIRQEVNGFGYR